MKKMKIDLTKSKKFSDLPRILSQLQLNNSEVRLLCEFIISEEKFEDIIVSDTKFTENQLLTIADIRDQLSKSIPIAQITGKVYFHNDEYEINNHVLIPRIETERLVDLVVDYLKESDLKSKKVKILEVGVGSGCISISLLKALASLNIDSEITGTDISQSAIDLAEKNKDIILKGRLAKKVNFQLANIVDTSKTRNNLGKFDIIISNPPYIPTKQIKYLAKSVKDHEPRLALDGGKYGTDIIEQIINFSIDNNIANIFLEIHSKSQFLRLKKKYENQVQMRLEKDIFGRYRYLIIL